jgi:ABC-type uncharacterized transport system ATPase subunit
MGVNCILVSQTEVVVEMNQIYKSFPGVQANAGIDFALRRGEIHALLGENGAGKTTLMNILYGLYDCDSGEIRVAGKTVHFHSPLDAIAAGLGMVHQHFMLVHTFTVAENMILGQKSPKEPLLENVQTVHARIQSLSERYGLDVNPGALIANLSVGEQQRVEILKALYRQARVLILDEPTAVLTPQEAEELLAILRRLAAEGLSIVLITHKLEEILAVSDRITVLRDGKVVDCLATDCMDKAALAYRMVGREVLLQVERGPAHPGETALEIHGLHASGESGLPALRGIDLTVRSGEIVGIAGVAGNGQMELEAVLAGLRKASAGSVRLCGQDVTNATPHSVGAAGLAHIPSDRYAMGLLEDFSVAENLFLERMDQPPFTRRGWLDWDVIRSEAAGLIQRFDVRTPSVDVHAGKLSGGNAQKLVLARELARQPRVLLAAQPTRGLDVSAIEFVHRSLIEQRDAGLAILLISTELDEILALSDRILVMYGGQIIGQMDAADADLTRIGLLLAGAAQAVPQGQAA